MMLNKYILIKQRTIMRVLIRDTHTHFNVSSTYKLESETSRHPKRIAKNRTCLCNLMILWVFKEAKIDFPPSALSLV